MSQQSDSERLHYALALLSGFEWHDGLTHRDHCPTCGYPRERGHEPGCSLRSVLTGQVPHRLVHSEQVYGDAAFGYNGRDRRRFATPVVAPMTGTQSPPASDDQREPEQQA